MNNFKSHSKLGNIQKVEADVVQGSNQGHEPVFRLKIRRGEITKSIKSIHDEVRDLPFPKTVDWDDDYEREGKSLLETSNYIKSLKLN